MSVGSWEKSCVMHLAATKSHGALGFGGIRQSTTFNQSAAGVLVFPLNDGASAFDASHFSLQLEVSTSMAISRSTSLPGHGNCKGNIAMVFGCVM